MKQKLFIFLALFFLLLLLIGLNAASYTQKEKIPDTENYPNRSTYNTGATGTRAFYDLLAETGKPVRRWQERFPASGYFDADEFSTFVIIGTTRRGIEPDERENIQNWVARGGTLVVIDRRPSQELISTTANWEVSARNESLFTLAVDSSDQSQMIGDTDAAKPAQPTVYTMNVNGVQPSRFAASIIIRRFKDAETPAETEDTDTTEPAGETAPAVEETNPDAENTDENANIIVNPETDERFKTPEPTPVEPVVTPTPVKEAAEVYDVSATAPVIHLANKDKNLLADFPYGQGRIIFLSDPYIVSNAGIRLVDNAQLGINIVTARQGNIAFDEYHQGYGQSDNRLFEYFAGTPVVPIFLQIFLLIGLIFYSQSRRFARALPGGEPDRLTKLEYVSAMAELQGRTKAFDLAIENIYREFRRRVTRLFGIDNHTATREDIAEKIAERTKYKKEEIADLMFKCEDIMHGEPTKKKEIVALISRLREVEDALGLRRGKKRG